MRPTADARDEEHPGVRCGGEDLRVVTRATRHLAWLDTGGDRRAPENVADSRRKIHRWAIAERLDLDTEVTFARDLLGQIPDLGDQLTTACRIGVSSVDGELRQTGHDVHL